MATYPSSLTDTEWELLEPLLPKRTETMRGRPVENPRRDIIAEILYILKNRRGLAHDAQRFAPLENLLSLLSVVVGTRLLKKASDESGGFHEGR